MLIKAAIEQGIRPTSLILRVQPRGKWNKYDFLCSEAFAIVEREKCSQCGLPRWMCHNDDGDIGFHLVEDICYATKTVETDAEKKSKNKKYKAPKGTRIRPEPFRYSKRPIDMNLRDAYYQRQSEATTPPES